jgi:ribosome recycling factor
MQPLKAVANIAVPDAKTVQIQCWDKSLMSAVEKAIQISDIGINPVNDGVYIRLNIPPLTEDRRKDLVKVVHRMAEEARIVVRTERQQANGKIGDLEKAKTISEDDARGFQKKLQDKVDQVNKTIDEVAKKKEVELLTI